MRIVSSLLKKVIYPALSRVGAFRLGSDEGLAVITYHGVVPPGYESIDAALDGNLISAESLRRQLRLLKKQYDVVSPEDVLAFLESGKKLPCRAVLLTCDDGLLNCLTDMLPVLREEDVKCLFFATGSSCQETRTMLWYEELCLILLNSPAGPFTASSQNFVIEEVLGDRAQRRAVWWKCVRQMSRLDPNSRAALISEIRDRLVGNGKSIFNLGNSITERRFGLMTRTEMLELVSAGMTVGAHTITHPVLSCQDPDAAYKEISQSRRMVESSLGIRVWAFAYPFGDPQSTTREVIGMAEKAGYQAAFLNFGGGLGSDLPRYALPRIHVTDQMSLPEFQAHVSGFDRRLRKFRKHSRNNSA